MAIPARLRIDLTLGNIAGLAQCLSRIEGFEPLYFEALRDQAIEVLQSMPLYPFESKKKAMRYVKRLEKALSEAEMRFKGQNHTLGSALNFMLAEAQDLYDDMRRKGSKHAHKILPLIEMLEQYIETCNAYKNECIEEGIRTAAVFRQAIEEMV